MVRRKLKWKCVFFLYLVSVSVFAKSIPVAFKNDLPLISDKLDTLIVEDGSYVTSAEFATDNPGFEEDYIKQDEEVPIQEDVLDDAIPDTTTASLSSEEESTDVVNSTHIASLLRNEPVRPGQTIRDYAVEISINGNSFTGRVTLSVTLNADTSEDDIRFHVGNLNIVSVVYGIMTLTNPTAASFGVDDGVLEIEPPATATSYIFLIEYTGTISSTGRGMYSGSFDGNNYLAMNLNPTYARYVFPCMDEPTQESTISFTINNAGYNIINANSIIDTSDNDQVTFTALQGPPHRWGMVAHSFTHINNPFIGSRLYIRPGLSGQESQANVIINAVFSRIEEWTNKPYAEIQMNQNDDLHIIALPDITRDWVALSNVPIWEPYILMPTSHAVMQRKLAMVEISTALARQWFGYVVFPENWRYQWITTGLASHAGYEAVRAFQGAALENDNTIIDMNAVFVSDVIQEALLEDGYSSALPLEPDSDLYTEEAVREHIYGLVKKKAPALMWMFKSVLGASASDPSIDYLQTGAMSLLSSMALQTHNSRNFYDAINSEYRVAPNPLIEDLQEYFEPWILNSNYPIVNVQLRAAGVILTQERFAFVTTTQMNYQIPITYTTSVSPNFDNLDVQMILETNVIIDLFMDEEDWFLANIQGQGYYRVNYDVELWERIILALEDPTTRETIHPLNRATLVDDSLNLARAGKLNYDVAFRVLLTMEHETNYSVWKAFIRNMEFLRKKLTALVFDDEDLDPDIYLRMVRRTIGAVESQIGFYPDPLIIEDAMTSMTRGIVMEHACLAGYQPCIAAAMDWFYADDGVSVNADIPHDIRPAVYCTMMREGGDSARDALLASLQEQTHMYERLVIARALGCSSDESYLLQLLQDTVSGTDPLTVEERSQFFISMINSNNVNADLGLRFIRQNTAGIRSSYGGPEKLEEIIRALAEACGDIGMTETFQIWVESINSNLDESLDMAVRAADIANENLIWITTHMDTVYEWIDENDAHTVMVSVSLLIMGFLAVILQ